MRKHRELLIATTFFLYGLSTTMAFAQRPSVVVDEIPSGLSIGHILNGKYSINHNFGIEQLNKGKVWTFRYQTWYLSCDSPSLFGETLPFNTDCSLNRIVMDEYPLKKGTRLITGHNHSIFENTLKITNADWKNGKLDFTITFTDKSTVEVMVRMKYWRSLIFLDSFKAIGISRGLLSDSMEAVEYRIPQYSYILTVPVFMEGFKSEEDKKHDDAIRSLSSVDRIAWEKVEKAMPKILDDKLMHRAIPEYDKIVAAKRELTAQEWIRLKNFYGSEVATFLSRSGLSEKGQRVLRTYFENFVSDMGKE